MEKTPTYTGYGHGKLLLTGEYAVLDGAKALAVPTRLGQRFTALGTADRGLRWTALDHFGGSWFDARFSSLASSTGDPVGQRILQLLRAADDLRAGCTAPLFAGTAVRTQLEFDRAWGLGSSSTLVHCLAEYLRVDPYQLLDATFGGSGYDIACAGAAGAVVYVRNTGDPEPDVRPAPHWPPPWARDTFFIYRNRKQNSREGIRRYRKQVAGKDQELLRQVSALTERLLSQPLPLRTAAQILRQHERVIGGAIATEPVQESLFPDFRGAVKSLGAWGGDFMWALPEPGVDTVAYFNARGYRVVIPYDEMVL